MNTNALPFDLHPLHFSILALGIMLRVPVVSGIEGLAAAVRARLSAANASPAQLAFSQSTLQVVEVPPPPERASEWRLSGEQREALEQATVLLADASTGARLLLGSEQELVRPTQLQWVQSTYAGIEPFFKLKGEHTPAFTLTRAGGIMPQAMAQYVFGWIVALERQFLEAEKFQQRGEYAQAQMRYRSYQPLTIGILGLGDIGKAIGLLLKTAGFRVAGFKRHVDPDEVRSTLSKSADQVSDDLDVVLAQSDYIVNVLPSTPATRYVLTEERLAACHAKKPVFINVGRGDVIAEETIVSALDKDILSKAVLDVFEVEPLPKSSKLWTHPKALLTPHVSALSLPEDVADVFVRNLDRFLSQQELLYPVEWSKGY